MKHAELLISDELLRHVLAIPENVRVLGVVHDPYTAQWSLVLSGEGLPDGCESIEGQRPKVLKATYFKDNELDIVSSVTWSV